MVIILMIIQYNHDEASDSWESSWSGMERFYSMPTSGRNGSKEICTRAIVVNLMSEEAQNI